MNGHPDTSSAWKEHTHADGRLYYYNSLTKVTQWTKPEALMTPTERALATQPWKEYTAAGGRKYWYHTETKETTWEMPDVYKNALAQSQPPQRPPAPTTTFVAGGMSTLPHYNQPRDRDDYQLPERIGPDRQISYGGGDNARNAVALNSQTDPEYPTFEDAEAAFMKLMKRVGVQPDWSWEQTVRATVKDPQYRALKDPKDRKTAFEKYVVEVRAQEKDKEKERLAKLRSDFASMLRSHSEIKHYTRWKTARPIIEKETIFRSAKTDDERKHLFDDYIIELRKSHAEREATNRKAAMDELTEIFRALDLEPYTRWSKAQEIITSNERFTGDEKFQFLTKLDLLKAFENHIKSLERSFNDTRQKQKNLKARRERQNRDRFLELLKDLKSAGKIKAGTKWKDIHPLIEDDPRYVAMMGQSGSTPLDLFWDTVEEEERALRTKRSEVLDVLDDQRYELTTKTTFEEFLSVMHADRRTANIDRDSMTIIFERLREKVQRRSEENKHHAERSQRRAIDELRSKIKHLDPPVVLGDTWEQVRPRVEKLEEYRALDTDELRHTAFDKFMRRLKEKEEDQERDRDRIRRDHRDRDRERDRLRDRERDREYRNGHGDAHRRHRTRTRSPEPDAYEEDRKKAQANREKQYRKAGSSTGLSPPYRRDRDERERDKSTRQVSLSHYDRERREREVERERLYVSRADPREKGSELDYGESRPGSMRRRRDSDEDSPASRRDSKRARRDITSREPTFSPRRHRSRTPAVAVPAELPKEDPGLRSGSEEGEIEED
ncbi:putative formin binding protein [Lepidopterella palustris CBS 459.81]|uniref:Putative formin binding protein n=1 Tax=Lepidopterella palustris CBS 459.81 TaxID=1314670 RepID=A0A8E2EKU0_9PEZI|nr:putative formin binding protein [Lepidopterella palustris CBS 459.81]